MLHLTLRSVACFLFFFISNRASAESILRGTIKNVPNGTIDYYYKEHIIERTGSERGLELVNNQFEIRLDNIDPVVVTLSFDNQELEFFLLPNDSIRFSCDAKDIKNSLKIKSSNHDDQVFLTSLSMIASLKWKGMAPYKVEGMGWEDVPHGLTDSLDREVAKQQDAFKKGKGSSLHLSKLLWLRLLDTTYKTAASMMTAFNWQKAFPDQKQANKIRESDIDQLLKNVKIENKDLLQNAYYIEFLLWYDQRMYDQYWDEHGKNSASQYDWSVAERFPFQDRHYQSPEVKYAVQTHVFCRNNFSNPDVFSKGVEKLNQMHPEGIYREQLQKMALAARRLSKGQPAPRFDLKDMKGNTVSLESLKGKVLYVDFWASWCLPCIRENKAVKELKPFFRNKNVVFVYITRDNNKAAWKEAVARQGIEGLHLFGGGTAVFEQYQVNGVPQYVLIDKDGNIVSADAPRPSDTKELQELIGQLLEK